MITCTKSKMTNQDNEAPPEITEQRFTSELQRTWYDKGKKEGQEEVIQMIREFIRNNTRGNGDYSAVGAYNDISDFIYEIERDGEK